MARRFKKLTMILDLRFHVQSNSYESLSQDHYFLYILFDFKLFFKFKLFILIINQSIRSNN